jgi:hypothetical protein
MSAVPKSRKPQGTRWRSYFWGYRRDDVLMCWLVSGALGACIEVGHLIVIEETAGGPITNDETQCAQPGAQMVNSFERQLEHAA